MNALTFLMVWMEYGPAFGYVYEGSAEVNAKETQKPIIPSTITNSVLTRNSPPGFRPNPRISAEEVSSKINYLGVVIVWFLRVKLVAFTGDGAGPTRHDFINDFV